MKWSLLLMLLLSTPGFAIDYPYLVRSPRGLLMGDAFTAVNDDEYSLFYNPASLARHRRDFTISPLSGHLSGTNVLNDLDRFSDFPSDPVAASDVLMDYPVHASAGVTPGFKLFNVGFSYIVNDSYDLLLRNRTHPTLDLDLRSDRGVQLGVGIPLGPGRISKKSVSGSQTSLGISAKYIKRKGLRDSLALAGTTVPDSLGQSEINNIVQSLGQIEGQAWGFDAGLEHVIKQGNGQLIFGLSALNISGTDFKLSGSNPNKLKLSNIRDQVNLGVAGGHDYKFFHYILSADVRALNEQMDFGKRLRFGAELGFPGISLIGGFNSGYYSYGVSIDMLFMRLTAGFYDIEIGSKYKQQKSERFVLYLNLFNFSFDA